MCAEATSCGVQLTLRLSGPAYLTGSSRAGSWIGMSSAAVHSTCTLSCNSTHFQPLIGWLQHAGWQGGSAYGLPNADFVLRSKLLLYG
jgi:hypothetical protein